MKSIAELVAVHPQLANLRGRVPDDVIEREVSSKLEAYLRLEPVARSRIPSVRLCDVFGDEVEQAAIRLERFLGQWGNISVEEVCKICLIVSWLRPGRVFEFGTYNGMTTLQIALNAPADCLIYTLDVDPTSDEASRLEIGEIDGFLAQKAGGFVAVVGEYFSGSPQSERIRQILVDSLEFDATPLANTVDFVFVDAGHTYPYVKSDSQKALEMLTPNGVIVWHDYLQLLHPDVTQFLVELESQGHRIQHLRGTNLAVLRNGG